MAQYGTHFGRNKIQYEDFDWEVLKTKHFDIFHYPEMRELAEIGAGFAEEAYEELESKFATSLNRRVPIIFYSSNLHFKQTNVIQNFIPDGVGGFFEFLKGRVVIPANGNVHRFKRVIRHELVHVFTHAKVTRVLYDHRQPTERFLPLWFTEGLAEYWSGEPDYQHNMMIRDAITSNFLAPLDNIYRINGTYLMYKQGEAICKFLSDTYGEDKILKLMENFWKNPNFKKTIEITVHEHFGDVAKKWEIWLRNSYYEDLKEMELSSLISEGISIAGFSAKPVHFKHEDGTQAIYYVGNRNGYTNLFKVKIDSNYTPTEKPEVVIEGERSNKFESFHFFESKMDLTVDGRLAFVTKSGESDVIHVHNVETGVFEATYEFENLVAVYSPSWNPDGTKLTFSSIDKSGFSDLYIFDLENEILSQVTTDHYDDKEPSWSPDGSTIVFSSDRTSLGKSDAYNLFLMDLETGGIRYLTFGKRHDFSPTWSPDGKMVMFTSTQPDETGKNDAQNVWVVPVEEESIGDSDIASVGLVAGHTGSRPHGARRVAYQLSNVTSAIYDPIWTEDDKLVFTSFEHFRFSVRSMGDMDDLIADSKKTETFNFSKVGSPWNFEKVGEAEGVSNLPYEKKYNLDLAQTELSQNAIWGTSGGAFLAFSDMLGDDYWQVVLYSSSQGTDNFLRGLSFGISRLQLNRRTNTSYGIFRHAGWRYDITDPDASQTFPFFWESLMGGAGAISYPLSKFSRVEFGTQLAHSSKDIPIGNISRQAVLLSNSVSFKHDNALYHYNGPIDGWRAALTAAYTTDVKNSNVNYFTLIGDVRHYLRIRDNVTFASRFLGNYNKGREARLFILGGSWDLRGYPLWKVRGRKMWFTSQELRFPILNRPGLYVPLIAPLGIANLRGALFFDAAHAWNFEYSTQEQNIFTGRTIGSSGLGFRLNLFGGFVLRYDIGYRFDGGLDNFEKDRFTQFFFGWDF